MCHQDGCSGSGQHPSRFSLLPGNEHNNFRINPSTGLVMRGVRHLDREQNSSHVLEVEAYNTEQGPMRSSVRVRASGLPRAEQQAWEVEEFRQNIRDASSGGSHFQPLQACRKFERLGMEMLMKSLPGPPVGGEEVVGGFFVGFLFLFSCDISV